MKKLMRVTGNKSKLFECYIKINERLRHTHVGAWACFEGGTSHGYIPHVDTMCNEMTISPLDDRNWDTQSNAIKKEFPELQFFTENEF